MTHGIECLLWGNLGHGQPQRTGQIVVAGAAVPRGEGNQPTNLVFWAFTRLGD